jgi:molybdate transport system substrate-binding protein
MSVKICLGRSIMKTQFVVAAACGLLLSSFAQAAEIKVLVSGAVKDAYLELMPQFENSSGHKVATTWAGTVDIKKRMAAGEIFDLVIVAAPEIDAFITQGKIIPGSRVDIVKSSVGVAVKAGAPKPDISSSDALKKGAARRQVGRILDRPERRLRSEPVPENGHRGRD